MPPSRTRNKAKHTDFKRRKAKFGKKAAKPVNFTDTSLTFKKITLTEQSILADKTNEDFLSSRMQTIPTLLVQTKDSSRNVRRAACLTMASMIAKFGESLLKIHGHDILQAALPVLTDRETIPREAAATLLIAIQMHHPLTIQRQPGIVRLRVRAALTAPQTTMRKHATRLLSPLAPTLGHHVLGSMSAVLRNEGTALAAARSIPHLLAASNGSGGEQVSFWRPSQLALGSNARPFAVSDLAGSVGAAAEGLRGSVSLQDDEGVKRTEQGLACLKALCLLAKLDPTAVRPVASAICRLFPSQPLTADNPCRAAALTVSCRTAELGLRAGCPLGRAHAAGSVTTPSKRVSRSSRFTLSFDEEGDDGDDGNRDDDLAISELFTRIAGSPELLRENSLESDSPSAALADLIPLAVESVSLPSAPLLGAVTHLPPLHRSKAYTALCRLPGVRPQALRAASRDMCRLAGGRPELAAGLLDLLWEYPGEPETELGLISFVGVARSGRVISQMLKVEAFRAGVVGRTVGLLRLLPGGGAAAAPLLVQLGQSGKLPARWVGIESELLTGDVVMVEKNQ